ncbi:AraC family transcriptional regulator [Nocardia sp. NPDC048505]|uniref:helix-turn-helix domain-containing protein n=1 Tax=Nocardia sp. NPDC048505 TaxID=3155756 RepID=UPI0033EE96D5
MDAALDLRGTYQVRARQVVHAPAALTAGLDVLRCFGFDVTEPEPVRRRKISGGTVKIVFALDGVFGGRSIQPTALVVGLHDRAGMTEHAGRMHSVQLQLEPLAARRLLGVPLDDLRNTAAPLDELLGPPVAELTERLAETGTWPERFAQVTTFLRERFAAAEPPDPVVAHAVRVLRHSGGGVPIGVLAREIGWSHRHFRRRFADQVGLAPKDYGSLLRFSGALDALTRPGADAGAVAARFGYYDQSHLTRAFQRFAGAPPGRLIRAAADSSKTAAGVRF